MSSEEATYIFIKSFVLVALAGLIRYAWEFFRKAQGASTSTRIGDE